MYNTTAFLYEATAAFERPDTTCEEIHSAFQHAGSQPPGLLGDLGSGTGLMSILFAQKGWQVYGVEQSPAMLAIAEAKKQTLPPELQDRLEWTQGDIQQFHLPQGLQLDGAVCLCNTINHLTDWQAVTGFIDSVGQALRPGGLLIVDSDRRETFQGFFNHPPTVVWEDSTCRVIRACAFDEMTGRANHTAIVERAAPAGWQQSSEEHMALQYHPEIQLREAFEAGGFQLENAAPFNPFPSLYRGFIPKVLWTFRKL